jgi:hypothetical protein|tara:strand:+ start:115 stop:678 length:564 start_codon:yes stop_codon:yes gene_type:complete
MERYVIFNPDTGEVLSLPNVKPTEGSFIKVEPTSVEGILKGLEQLSHYCVEYSKRKKQYELKSRLLDEIDSYNVNDLIYEVPTRKTSNADLTITQNIKDTCWKVCIGGNLKVNLLSQKVSFNNKLSFSVTRKNDPNILYKTLRFDFSKLENSKYLILPFTEDFEFLGEPVSIYTMKRFDKYALEVIR